MNGSLSTIIKQYTSESDNEDDNSKLPDTSWTQCMDPATEHPYYWNIETKEVTWEKPLEYEKYLKIIHDRFPVIPSSSWMVNYSEDKRPYYVNQYTRIVSWDKPVDFKESFDIPETKSNTSMKKNKLSVILPNQSSEQKNEKSEQGIDKNEKEKVQPKKIALCAYESDDSDSETKECKNSTNLTIEDNSNITNIKPDDSIDKEILRLESELNEELSSFDIPTVQSSENNVNEKKFQRKKRIQFEKCAVVAQSKDANIESNNSNHSIQAKEDLKKNLYSNFKKSHVEFTNDVDNVQSETDNRFEENYNKCDNQSNDSIDNDLTSKIEELSELINGKVKFLCVGRQEVSAVQIMNIQLEALSTAYSLSSLNSDYFFKWLKTTADDLEKLEQYAAPEGWKCYWDRQTSQYFYKNSETGDIRWEFPVETKLDDETQADEKNNSKILEETPSSKCAKISDDDEMDISTTPPPNEQEQLKYTREYSESTWNKTSMSPKQNAPTDIVLELASFYSDIANIATTSDTVSSPPPSLKSTIIESVPVPPPPIIGSLSSNTDTDRSLSPPTSIIASASISTSSITSTTTTIVTQKNKIVTEDVSNIPKKKKKVKVTGLQPQMKEVSSMVAKWQRAKKELDMDS